MIYEVIGNNQEKFKIARKIIPGGVNSPLRGFCEVGGTPICVQGGKGAYVYDVENKAYVDFLLGFGPVILGHAPKCVIKNVNEQIEKGSVYAATNVLEIKLARMIIDSTPCIDKVRFVCSGTEAVMSAVRLAKGYTNREMILKYSGSYHGHADSVLGQSSDNIDNRNSLKGVDSAINQNTIVVQYNDLEQTKNAFKKYPDKIACILIEPYACNMGLIKPSKEFIEGLRELCNEYGALLIFDEVITGFRMKFGSVYRDFGVVPDLITFGKVIGGGAPIGAYVGKEHIMSLISAEEQGVYQSGTFAGNALSMASGIAVISELAKGEAYKILEEKGQLLESLILNAFKENNIPYVFSRYESVFSITLCEDGRSVNNYLDVSSQDFEKFSKIHQIMLERGFLLPPAADEVMHLCTEHSEKNIVDFVDNLIEAIITVRGEK